MLCLKQSKTFGGISSPHIYAYVPHPAVRDVLSQQECYGPRARDWSMFLNELNFFMKNPEIDRRINRSIKMGGLQIYFLRKKSNGTGGYGSWIPNSSSRQLDLCWFLALILELSHAIYPSLGFFSVDFLCSVPFRISFSACSRTNLIREEHIHSPLQLILLVPESVS